MTSCGGWPRRPQQEGILGMVSLAELVDRAGDGDTVAIPPILTPGTGTVVINRSLHLVCTSGAEVSDDIVVGGAGSLEVAPGLKLYDAPLSSPPAQAAAWS